MANRRMFSNRISKSAKFLQMPLEAQALYFHLILNADDDGVVETYPITKMLCTADDIIKILIVKQFVIKLNEDQVMLINNWNEHNVIRADRKIDSIYKHLIPKNIDLLEAKPRIDVKDNTKRIGGQSTDGISKVRLSKVNMKSSTKILSLHSKLDHDTYIDPTIDPETGDPIKKFGKRIDGKKEPKYLTTYNETVQRIVKGFQKMCKRELGATPIANISWYKQANRAISTGGLTEKDVKKLLTEWFTQRLPEGEMCSLTRALSDVQINKFKMEYLV